MPSTTATQPNAFPFFELPRPSKVKHDRQQKIGQVGNNDNGKIYQLQHGTISWCTMGLIVMEFT